MKPGNGPKLKAGQRIGKYQLRRKLGGGGYGVVWVARDTVEGIRVALKVPYPEFSDARSLRDFRREAQILAKLDHPHILRMKTAESIEGLFLIVSDLGQGTLAKTMKRALPLKRGIAFFRQALEAVAYAHSRNLLHRDIKPENFILFPQGQIRLGDFGIARILQQKLPTGTISGTIGYMAPEQAYGKPVAASDVFSLGLLCWALLTGRCPTWPFQWPFSGYDLFRRKAPPALEHFIRKACAFEERKRFRNAQEMLREFQRILPKILQKPRPKRKPKRTARVTWKHLRQREFLRHYRKILHLTERCPQCSGPLSEVMAWCPWCRAKISAQRFRRQNRSHPESCRRCHRSLKSEWRFCPWCFGAKRKGFSDHIRQDARYTARCSNAACSPKLLMPWMRYCPWCRKKVRRPWRLRQMPAQCPRCRWAIARDFWAFCPWCCETLDRS